MLSEIELSEEHYNLFVEQVIPMQFLEADEDNKTEKKVIEYDISQATQQIISKTF